MKEFNESDYDVPSDQELAESGAFNLEVESDECDL